MIRLVVACTHHDAHDSTVRCFASLNCACCSRFNFCKCVNAASSLDQIRRHFSSCARCESSEKLFSRIQLGSFTPDEVIDPGAVPRTAVLAHMLRTSLKTAIICLTLKTWLRCVSFVTQQGVSFSSNWHLSLHHNKHVYHSVKELHLCNLQCLLKCLDGRCSSEDASETKHRTDQKR